MSEQHYLELCESPVQFEHASNVNNVFFDEANKQVFAVRSGGATGVVVKGPEDKSSVAFRMDDKGEVKCIKFSIGNKILAVQRTSKSVDFINFIPDYPHTEFTQECKTKNANVLGFCWTNWNEIVFITDQGIEFYQVFPDKRSLKLLKSQSINVNWYQYCPETAVILLSTTVQGNILQPFAFRNGTMSKMSKFEIELPVVPKPAKLSLSERDIAMATIPGADLLLSDEVSDTTSDLMLAKMLQMQFDREFDDQLRREEKKFNGDSKVSISFENYRMVHPYEDSDSSEDEVDWQDTRHDPYRADKPQTTPRRGFTGKGKNITTKHDEVTCGRKNTARMDNFAPEVHVGDGLGMDLKLSNQVFNSLKQHCYSEQRRSARLHEKKEHSTAEQAVDPRTRLLMYKMVNAGVLEHINGCISTGKESVVFHADGGSLEEQPVPDEVVLKVFKTTLNEFKNRDRYIKDDYRFIDRYSKLNPRKIIRLWAEKEMHNLTRMKKAEIPCPEVVLLKKHILVMSFIGKDHVPAPKLKDVKLGSEDMKNAFYQVLHLMQLLYQECNLVHADLSEYNMLWHEGKVWLIDVSQSVEPTHPHGLEFLFRDCRNVSTFFQKRGVSEAMSAYELFNAVSGLNIPVGAEDEAEFMSEIVALEKRNEDHVQRRGKKSFPVSSEDGGPPLKPDADD